MLYLTICLQFRLKNVKDILLSLAFFRIFLDILLVLLTCTYCTIRKK